MSYKSKVILAFHAEAEPLLFMWFGKHKDVRTLLFQKANEIIQDYKGEKNAWCFVWNNFVWNNPDENGIFELNLLLHIIECEDYYEEEYPSHNLSYRRGLEEFVKNCESEHYPDYDSFKFVRLGEEIADCEVQGGGFPDLYPKIVIDY